MADTATANVPTVEVPTGKIAIVSPCHQVRLYISTRSEGPAYMSTEVPDEMECSEPLCMNTWDENGQPKSWNQ